MRHEGRCHCGNLRVTFETAQDPAQIPRRRCGCTFCRKHGAIWVTDPHGTMAVRIEDGALLSRYRFGLGTSEFLVCGRCGVHVGAVCQEGAATCGALNCNVLDDAAAFTQPPQPVDYDGERAEERVARRRRGWTPTTVDGPRRGPDDSARRAPSNAPEAS